VQSCRSRLSNDVHDASGSKDYIEVKPNYEFSYLDTVQKENVCSLSLLKS